jgi:hypothetical protein
MLGLLNDFRRLKQLFRGSLIENAFEGKLKVGYKIDSLEKLWREPRKLSLKEFLP